MTCSGCLRHVHPSQLAEVYVPDPTWKKMRKVWLCALCWKFQHSFTPSK